MKWIAVTERLPESRRHTNDCVITGHMLLYPERRNILILVGQEIMLSEAIFGANTYMINSDLPIHYCGDRKTWISRSYYKNPTLWLDIVEPPIVTQQ